LFFLVKPSSSSVRDYFEILSATLPFCEK